MRFLTICVMMAGVLIVGGCRHDYNPTPYYCQPNCGVCSRLPAVLQ